MKCTNCASELPADAVFCHICGTKQESLDAVFAQVNAIEKRLSVTGAGFNNQGRAQCQTWIGEYGFEEVCTAVDIAIKQYLHFDENDKPIRDSVHEVFNKIPGICYNRKKAKVKPYLADAQMLVNYALKKFYFSEFRERILRDYVERILYLYSRMNNYSDMFQDLFWELKRTNDKWDFMDYLEQIIADLEEDQREN